MRSVKFNSNTNVMKPLKSSKSNILSTLPRQRLSRTPKVSGPVRTCKENEFGGTEQLDHKLPQPADPGSVKPKTTRQPGIFKLKGKTECPNPQRPGKSSRGHKKKCSDAGSE